MPNDAQPLPEIARAVREDDLRNSQPVYAVWEITLRCDLACNHCGSRAGKPRPDELSTAQALDTVRQLGEMGVREVTLIGGEAYLRHDWPELVRAIRAAGMNCSMTTGGRQVDAAMARTMADAGLQQVSVSLDGLEATHDTLRGVRGSYRAALRTMDLVREAGITIASNTQINQLNFGELEQIFEVIAEHGSVGWQVQLTAAMGRAADRPEWLLQPYQVLELMPRLIRLKRRGNARGITLFPANNIGYFGPHEGELRTLFGSGGHWVGCTAGITTLGLEADGTIKGCPSLPTAEYAGGNLKSDSLRDVWQRSAKLRVVRDGKELWGFCASCYYSDSCQAGCTWTSHVLLGKAGNMPYCHHRALELAKQGKRERIELREKAPGIPFDHGTYALVLEDAPELAAQADFLARPLPPGES